MAEAAATSSAVNAESYIGSLIYLITKSEIRYEGFMFHLDAKESTIALRNVKSYGTEGRRKDGPQIPPSERIYEYIKFRGSDLKDLQVLSAPYAQSTFSVPDDPAIIQPHCTHPSRPAIALASPSDFQATNHSSNVQSGLQAPPSFQENLPANQSVKVSVSWSPIVAPPPLNVDAPALPNYWPGFAGRTGETSQQQPFPPSPQGLLNNPIQQSRQHFSVNTSLPGGASNFPEAPRQLMPPVCTGSVTFVCTVPPAPSEQSMVNSSGQILSSATSSGANPAVRPDTQTGESLLGPAPFQMVPTSVPSTVGRSGASHGKKPVASHASDHGSSDYENAEEAPPLLPMPLTTKLHESASSSSSFRYANRRHIQNREDENLQMLQTNRGHLQGRGRGSLPNRTAMYNYQNYSGHSVGRGNTIIGAPLYPRHRNIGHGGGNAPNTTWYPRKYGSHGQERDGQVLPPVTRFTEDFDFEAMNQKFNKEEIWGLLGKSKLADAEGKEGDEKDGSEPSDGQDEIGDESPKLDQPIYHRDDFFDSISCRSLESDSSGKIKLSERRRIDAETFGEIPKPRKHRGGSSHGTYRGRGSSNAGRGCGARYRNQPN